MSTISGIAALGILGSSTSTGVLDLSGVFNAKTNAAALASAFAAAKAAEDRVLPPWDPRQDARTESAKLKDALTATTFIETKGRYFDQADIPDDHKKLYTLYLALSKLQTIADHAVADGTMSGTLPGLDKKLQPGLTEVLNYLSKTTFEKLQVSRSEKLPTAQSAITVPRSALSQYNGNKILDGAYDTPLGTITGNEVFDIAVKKAGVTTNVTIDLSGMGGQPLTLDNIADFINTTLAANGVVSRIARYKIADEQFGLRINGVETEALTFSAPAAAPAVYVAGVSGSGTDAAGLVTKFEDLAAADPTAAFSRRIEGEGGPVAAKATAIDAEGHLYVVGTTDGAIDSKVIEGSQDVFLTKYDSTGQVLWTRLLGASDTAEGFGVATDANGNVVIAGRVNGRLTQTAIGGGDDSFVTKYNGEGEEIFTHQIAPLADDGATTVAIGSDGSIYIGGYAKTAVSIDVSYAGGGDAFVTKLTASGTRVYSREFGTAGQDSAKAVALASDGNLLVASVEDGSAVLRKFDSATGAGGAMWSIDLGDLQGGTIGAITVDGNAIYVGGSSANASLDAGGTATILSAHQGGTDGFVSRIDDAGASASAAYTTYIGSGASDAVKGITAAAGAVYVTGETRGTLPGETSEGALNAFVGKLGAAGAVDWLHQYGARGGIASGASIAVDTQGSSVLDALGLPRGTIDYTGSRLLTANSTVRAGDTFSIAVNGKAARSIKISANETVRSLALKISGVLLQAGKASSVYSSGGDRLRILANPGNKIEFIAGKDGFDVLKGLGITQDFIMADAKTDEGTTATVNADGTILVPLGIPDKISLATKDDAKKAQAEIAGALRAIRLAYTNLTDPESLRPSTTPKPTGPVPAYLSAQLANYNTALARLQAGPSPALFF